MAQSIESIEKELEELYAKKKPLDVAIQLKHEEIREIKINNDLEKIEDMKQNGLDWGFMLAPKSDYDSTEMYKFVEQAAHKLGFRFSGRTSKTKQPCIQISLTYDDKECCEKYSNVIKQLAPYYILNENNCFYIDIMEYNLSANGSYGLWYDPKLDKAYLYDSNRFYRNDMKCLGSLDDAMDYVSENLWYDGKEIDDEDEYY